MKLKFFALLAVIALLFCGCGQESSPPETVETTVPPVTVGICLPGRSRDWRDQAQAIAAALEARDIQVRIEYASDDVLLQQSQVQSLLYMPVDCLVLGAYDPLTLCDTISDTSVPVLAYDRMLRFSGNVSGCVAADYYDAGQQIATRALSLCETRDGQEPLTVELFMGQPQDPNALQFYEGVMSVLQPQLDAGTVRCLSGRTLFEDVCLVQGTLEDARDLCFDYLSMEYEDSFPDILITGSDSLAEGCIQALEGMAFSPDEAWPVVTGLGNTEDGQLLIEAGSLTVTAEADTDSLVAECVRWVLALLEGTALPEHQTVHNGTADIPSYLQKMRLVPYQKEGE